MIGNKKTSIFKNLHHADFFNQKGVTLLELIVAISLFTMTMLLAMDIFKMIIDGQRDAIASQNVQENVRYVFEKMSKEIRTAKKSQGFDCAGTSLNQIYLINPAQNSLTFLNYHDECITYFLDDGKLKITKGSETLPITIRKININNLKFSESECGASAGQVILTVKMDAEAEIKAQYKYKMEVQTSVSSRHYE